MKDQPKQIPIQNLSSRAKSKIFGYLYKAPSSAVNSSQLQKEVIGVDPDTKEEVRIRLLTFKRITDGIIPEIFMLHSEEANTPSHVMQVIQRSKVSSINQLAYYVYERADTTR